MTYSPRAGVRNASLKCRPLEIGSFSVSKGSVEDREDVGHVVDTDGRAFEHRAEANEKHTLSKA